MNAKRVSAAAGVVLAAQKRRQTPAGIAAALEAAGLLQSPESAAELVALRKDRDGFRTQRNSVFKTNEELLIRVERADLERLQVENENRTLVRRVAELEAQATNGSGITSALTVIAKHGDMSNEVRREIRDLISTEDPHDGPLHHSYALGRDLPEEPEPSRGPCGYDDYHDGHPWADRPHVWCPGHSYADDEAVPS